MGFTIQESKHIAKELEPKTCIGDYYVIKNRKSEFFYEAKDTVEGIGITRDHFLKVLDENPKNREDMVTRCVENYQKFRELMVSPFSPNISCNSS
ncbi:MAG: hypothetical protein P4M11_07805 [Candidatus Pacebacteria bacterium]|nr:hypothetical protein [Candidatus Paceibacterota bacterium]